MKKYSNRKSPFFLIANICIALLFFSFNDSKDACAISKSSCEKASSSMPSKRIRDFGNETELRIAYFYPRAPIFRKIYRGARLDYEIESAQKLHRNFYLWANISWFPKKGAIDQDHHSKIHLIPLSMGLKYQFRLNRCLKLSLGLGPTYYFLNVADQSSCESANKHTRYRRWGGVFKSQFQWFFYHSLYLDFFADYLYLPLHGNENCASQAGGLKAGMGFGKHF